MFRFRRIWSSFFETRINPAEQYFCCLTPYPIELALKNKIPSVLKGCVLFMNRFFTQCIFISFVVTMFSVEVCAQTVIPPVGEAGIIEKLLRQSRPEFHPPPEDTPPQIIIEDSRTVKDPGAGPSFFVKKIVVEGNTLISDETLAPLVDVGEGMDVTLGILALMATEITALYSAEGYFLTRAVVPQQEIVDGRIKIQVFEGRIGKVLIEGNAKYDSEDFVARMEPVQEETVLREQTLEGTLLELNSILGVQVLSILRPGELPGTSDLVLKVTESRAYRVSFDVDNFGSRFTGKTRFGESGTVGNLLTFGDEFSARWVKSDKVQDSYNLGYIFPINHLGTKLRLAYAFSEYELGYTLTANAAGGTSHSFTLELSHLLSRTRTSQMIVRCGMDFKSSITEQTGANTGKDNTQDIYFGLGGYLSDAYLGRTFYDLKLQFGLKEGDPGRSLLSRVGGQGDILTSNLTLTRFQNAKLLNSYFLIKVNGQVNTARSLSSGQFSVGGMGTVRGYTLGEISGDMGYVASVEHVIPFPKKIKLLDDFPTLDQILSFNTFLDHGGVFVRTRLSTEKVRQTISGAGFGFKVNIPKKENKYPGVSFSFAYAWPVFRGNPAPADGSFGTGYLSALVNY